MRTNLKGFSELFRKRKNWGGIWKLDGEYLNNDQARTFVMRAISEGYEYDEEVPEKLVSEGLGLKPKK